MFPKAIIMTLVLGLTPNIVACADKGLDYFGSYGEGTVRYMQMAEFNHFDRNHQKQNIYEIISSENFNQAWLEIAYVLDRIPNHPKGLQIAGFVGRLTKNLSKAMFYYEKALNLYPQYALTHVQFGSFLVEIGQVDIGIEKLKRATDLDPNLTRAYVLLAKAYSITGNDELAREAAAKAKELGYNGFASGNESDK